MDIELLKVIRSVISENIDNHFSTITKSSEEDSIIGDYTEGRSFAKNKLANDIPSLEGYSLVEYIPMSLTKDKWLFESDTQFGATQLVEIIHIIDNNHYSLWRLIISRIYPETPETPVIKEKTGATKGYSKFIDLVNSKFYNKIDPKLL